MSEKKVKVIASEYFKDSKLFKVVSIVGGDKSATSSGVEYQLMCKKCKATTKKKGNAKTLETCSNCKRTWYRHNNEILEPEPVVKKSQPTKQFVEESDDDESSNESNTTTTSTTHYVDAILDHYDARATDRWYRHYLVKWHKSTADSYVRFDDFVNLEMLNKYEESLGDKSFNSLFPNPRVAASTVKRNKVQFRTKADNKADAKKERESDTFLNDESDDDDDVRYPNHDANVIAQILRGELKTKVKSVRNAAKRDLIRHEKVTAQEDDEKEEEISTTQMVKMMPLKKETLNAYWDKENGILYVLE